jgi:CDP-6-deoxy-D-xylo-4-hexulose-3-dehydrase
MTALSPAALRAQILALVATYYETAHKPAPFVPGVTPVGVAGRVYDATDMVSLVDSALDFWLSAGRFNAAFEQRLAERVGATNALTVNAGSSANLLAVSALMSPFRGERALKAGDEVITPAAGFPTTVNPLFLYGLTPVFVDIDIPTYNLTAASVRAAIGPKTRAIMAAHTLGNPFEAAAIAEIARAHNLILIEDCCDALGARHQGREVGSFGLAGTLSFYAAHTITTGEGGALFTSDEALFRAARSIRDVGKDCSCAPDEQNKCGKRYALQMGDLPFGFDHRYTYSNLGFNFKMTDLQAAIGCAQMDHLEAFIAKRRANFARLDAGLADLEPFFVRPRATPASEPSWFGYTLTLRDDAPFGREELLRFLNERHIATRLLFGGNLVRQPYMAGRPFRVAEPLVNSDRVMNKSFWLGVYPALDDAAIDYVIEHMHAFLRRA